MAPRWILETRQLFSVVDKFSRNVMKHFDICFYHSQPNNHRMQILGRGTNMSV